MESFDKLAIRFRQLTDDLARSSIEANIEEYLELERDLEYLKSDSYGANERLLKSTYENTTQRSGEAFEYISNVGFISEYTKFMDIAKKEEEVIFKSLETAEEDMRILDEFGKELDKDLEQLKIDEIQAITDAQIKENKKKFAKNLSDNKFLVKMKEQQQKLIDGINGKLDLKEDEIGYFVSNISGLTKRNAVIEENQRNGYIDLEAKEKDMKTVEENERLIRETKEKMDYLMLDKAKELQDIFEEVTLSNNTIPAGIDELKNEVPTPAIDLANNEPNLGENDAPAGIDEPKIEVPTPMIEPVNSEPNLGEDTTPSVIPETRDIPTITKENTRIFTDRDRIEKGYEYMTVENAAAMGHLKSTKQIIRESKKVRDIKKVEKQTALEYAKSLVTKVTEFLKKALHLDKKEIPVVSGIPVIPTTNVTANEPINTSIPVVPTEKPKTSSKFVKAIKKVEKSNAFQFAKSQVEKVKDYLGRTMEGNEIPKTPKNTETPVVVTKPVTIPAPVITEVEPIATSIPVINDEQYNDIIPTFDEANLGMVR